MFPLLRLPDIEPVKLEWSDALFGQFAASRGGIFVEGGLL
jgi:hypothetical protein